PPQLASRAADFALILGLVGASAQGVLIPTRGFVQQVWVHLGAKHGVGQLHLPHFLAIQIYDIYDRHNLASFELSRDVAATYFCLSDLRIKMYAPLGPGTEPRTSNKFSSVSTLTTFKFFA